MTLHLIKLCVGADSVEDLLAWRRRHSAPGQPWKMHTRQTPKRTADLLDGGSLYWVFKGSILCRQPILAIDTVGEGRSARCEVTLAADLSLTTPAPRRPFQGWRYLSAGDAPADLAPEFTAADAPVELARRLRDIGAW